MYIKTTFFHHFKWLHKAVSKMGGEAFANVLSLHVEIRLGNRVYVLHPMFTNELNGKKIYTHQFVPDVKNFIGWKPYSHRPTPELGKKLFFKTFVASHGLHTPAYATDDSVPISDVVVKKNISSFGDQISGPFKDSKQYRLNTEMGEYFERFTKGEIVKIWYWNERPLVMESKSMPSVTGDGKSTIKRLIDAHLKNVRGEGQVNWGQVEALLSFQDSKLDDILPENSNRLIDFRYISAFFDIEGATSERIEGAPSRHEPLRKLGGLIQAELVALGQADAAYSVDAIRDEQGSYWFLEVNFNPAIHPCLYMDMLPSLAASKVFRELKTGRSEGQAPRPENASVVLPRASANST